MGFLDAYAKFNAARRGIGPAESQALQQQQLLNAQYEGLIKRATALQDPSVRGYLMQNPQVAASLGLPTETVSGASASFPVDPGAGAAMPVGTGAPGGGGLTTQPQGQQQFSRTRGVLPPEVKDPQRELAQARANWFNFLTSGGQGGGTGAGGGGLPPMNIGGQEYVSGPIGPAGPTYVPQGTQTFKAGTLGPSGEIKPGEIVGGKKAVIEPMKGTATQRAKVNVYKGALERIDNFMKQFPQEERANFAGAINYTTQRGKDIGAQIPGVRRLTGPTSERFNRFKAGVSSIRRFLFEEGGKALTEQEMKVLEPLLISGMEAAGPVEFEAKLSEFRGALAERLAIEEQSGMPSPADQPAPAAAPSSNAPPTDLDKINARRKELNITDPYVARAKGGGVKKGQTALVGEAGPELVMRPQFIQGPAQVQPLQLAQSMPWAPRQLQAPQEQPAQQLIPPPRPDDSGLSRGGVGLRPEDIQAAQQGGQVIWDPVLGQAVVVPR